VREIYIIGGGLAGCEAAWHALRQGCKVTLYEMKPQKFSPAHKLPYLAELVCSNSLRSESLETGSGLLKEEMRRLDSLILQVADKTRVPAGSALAVDRIEFSKTITKILEQKIQVIRKEIVSIPKERPLIIATGPLTSEPLAESIKELIGEEFLYFHDAISPIVRTDSLNMDIIFEASRYNTKDTSYLNCPLDKEQYYHFVEELLKAEKVPLRPFEKLIPFEGCVPIELLAERGRDTLAYGPMKPVGLVDPKTGKQPYAVVQLRAENKEKTLYNMVGFQTRLKWSEQKRVFRMIPGLERAEFVRYGSLHRNTYIHSPFLLFRTLQLKKDPSIFFAGQITGVEGYIESAATGLLAGINVSRYLKGLPFITPPKTTIIGALVHYITDTQVSPFQPMNANFGILAPLTERVKRTQKKAALIKRALQELEEWKKRLAEDS